MKSSNGVDVAPQNDRRAFLRSSAALTAASTLAVAVPPAMADRAEDAHPSLVRIELPRLRVPLSFIIDDSTCLVNMGRFCMPQFAAAWPDRKDYDQPWQSWPAEIPDDFLRRFGEWCAEHGVRGKFSIVPYPACVGWLDRDLPGWSRQALQDSLRLVRELIVPSWDIHPEMITHTRIIDLKTGRAMAEINAGTMENSYPQVDKSVDELAAYLAYALRILKNCDLPCEGITTPGGFGNRVKDKLPLAVFEAVRDVYGTELPHYFKYISDRDVSTLPRLEGLRDVDSDQPRLTVNVPAGTGDWFGGWDGASASKGERYANYDASSGRMVELIERGVPAVMLCHWAGLYSNGTEEGLRQFQQVVLALERRFADQTRWMKVSEIGRYWTAKELTKVSSTEKGVQLQAPFACADFTVRLKAKALGRITWQTETAGTSQTESLTEVKSRSQLTAQCYWIDGEEVVVCFDLVRGKNFIAVG